jgi:hypothetical protein
VDIGLALEIDDLSLGVLAGVLLYESHGFVVRDLAVKILKELFVPNSSVSGHLRGELSFQSFGFF